jgi:cation diffusion facilitator CzcD-associated flavoprotein CzcO
VRYEQSESTGGLVQDTAQRDLPIAIIGAGFGGIGAAVRLLQAGYTNLQIFERADEVGGVWRDNSYPGAACDVPSHLYSFSFAPNPDWSRSYSHQPEIWAYLRRVAAEFGVMPHVRFGTEVRAARWDDAAARWRISTSRGDHSAAVLVVGSGGLSEPAVPALPGAAQFAGVSFHSARWDHSYDLDGKRVAVIGTGASAIQFIPAIQPRVAQLSVFQRTPPWVLPRDERAFSLAERRLMARFPLLRLLARGRIYLLRELLVAGFRNLRLMRVVQRAAERYLAEAVPDPELRARLTPDYAVGCKRILSSNDYYPAVQRPNVEIVTDPIAELRAHSVVTADGVERPIDAIIYGTGFQVTTQPIAERITGRDGRTLAAAWAPSPMAHLGTTVAGFPNMFILQGPGTGLGHTSVLIMIEAQIEHLVDAVRQMRARNLAAVEPRAEAQAAYVAALDRAMEGTVWTTGGCRSWYLDATGRNSTLWPGYTWQFRRRVRRFNPAEYLLRPAGSREPMAKRVAHA